MIKLKRELHFERGERVGVGSRTAPQPRSNRTGSRPSRLPVGGARHPFRSAHPRGYGLLNQLQSLGTVSAIDWNAYASQLSK